MDSKLQETEYIENYIRAKKLSNDVAGENAHGDSNAVTASKEEVAASGKNYKNASGGGHACNSSPRNHSFSNGSLPTAASSSTKNDKKHKGGGKSPKDPLENCIPNNQLGKLDALVR